MQTECGKRSTSPDPIVVSLISNEDLYCYVIDGVEEKECVLFKHLTPFAWRKSRSLWKLDLSLFSFSCGLCSSTVLLRLWSVGSMSLNDQEHVNSRLEAILLAALT